MPSRSPLAQYILTQISALGETPEQFASRVRINPSGFHKFIRGEYQEVRAATLAKIAKGLNRTPSDIMASVSPGAEMTSTDSELEAHVAAVDSLFRGIPRVFWPVIIKAVTGMAEAFGTPVHGNAANSDVTRAGGVRVIGDEIPTTDPPLTQGSELKGGYLQRPAFVQKAVTTLTRVTAGVTA